MNTFNEKKEFIDNFFLFLIELNLNRTDEEVLANLNSPVIERNLKYIKKKNLKAKAQLNKSRFQQAQELLNSLKKEQGEKLLENIKGALEKKEQLQLDALYRKFQDLTSDDIKAMLEDEKLIEIMQHIEQSDTIDESKEN